MEWERIRKRPEERFGAGLPNYEEYVSAFSWTQARALLDGLPGGGLNIAHEAVDRHVLAGRGEQTRLALDRSRRSQSAISAIRTWAQQATGSPTSWRGTESPRETGCSPCLAGVPELYFAALGTLKNGSVFSPLFSAFGPEPIKARMSIGSAKSSRHIRSVLPPQDRALAQRACQPGAHLADRFLATSPAGTIGLAAAMAAASDSFETVRDRCPKTWRLLHFTSGTTGRPKGAVHVHEAVVAHHVTGRLALDLHDG